MNLEYPEQCLLCLGSITVQQRQTTENNTYYAQIDSRFAVQSFQQLCEYLKIDFPQGSQKFKNVSKILKAEKKNGCESLLCSNCLEMVNGLSMMYSDLRRIQRRIDYGIRAIQDIVRKSDQDDNNQKSNGDDGNRSSENSGTGGVSNSDDYEHDNQNTTRRKPDRSAAVASSSVLKDYYEFVDTFRKLVKEVVTKEPEPMVLSEEGESLAKMYQQLEDDSDSDIVEVELEKSTSPQVLPEQDEVDDENMPKEDKPMEFIQEVPIEDLHEVVDDGGVTVHSILSNVEVSVVSDNDSDENSVSILEQDLTYPQPATNNDINIRRLSTMTGVSDSRTRSTSVSPSKACKRRRYPFSQDAIPFNKFKMSFNCDCCESSFDSWNACSEHRRKEHGIKSSSPVKRNPKPNNNGEGLPVRICSVCRQVFPSLTALRTHMDNEHQPKPRSSPVACETCGKQFLNEFGLRVHKRKPCKKSFDSPQSSNRVC